MEVSKEWFKAMMGKLGSEKESENTRGNRRIFDDAAKKTCLLYIQSWISRRNIGEHLKMSKEETEGRKDRKSYMLEIKELLQDMGRCEIYPTISGYTMG